MQGKLGFMGSKKKPPYDAEFREGAVRIVVETGRSAGDFPPRDALASSTRAHVLTPTAGLVWATTSISARRRAVVVRASGCGYANQLDLAVRTLPG